MKSALSFILLGCLACGSNDQPSNASKQQLVDGRPSCRSCKVELREVVVLGDSLDDTSVRPDAAGRECMVGRTSSGQYVVSGVIGGGQLSIYAANGSFIRAIGRRGAGPGEFGSMVRLAVGADDTLFVMDDSNLRVQVLTPAGEYVRSFPAPGRFRSFALLNSGELLVYHPPARVTDPLFRVLSPDGLERARFGTATRAGEQLDLETWIASPRRPHGFWTANAWKYDLYRWLGADSLAQTLTREVTWFPENAPYPVDAFRGSLPPPSLVHLWEDDAGRMWTYALVPDPDWVPGSPARPSPQWFRSTFDTIIEVIDVTHARLIATGSYDGRLGMICGSELMYTVVETADGDTRVQILSPTLVETQPEERR